MATPRVDAWLLVSGALLVGSAAATSPTAATVGMLAGALLLVRAVSARVLTAIVLVALFAWQRADSACREFEHRWVRVRNQLGEPRRCAGTGSVVASPVSIGGAIRLSVDFDELDCEGKRVQGPVHAGIYGGPGDVSRGARLFVVAKLASVRSFRNSAVGDPTPSAARRGTLLSGSALSVDVVAPGKGLLAAIDRARAAVRRRIAKTFAPDAQGLARALVLGENDLNEDDNESFKQSGLSHLLAVSGTHLVFAVVATVAALRAVLLRVVWLSRRTNVTRFASLVGMVLAPLYADFSGGSGSAWRAAWMLVLVFAARFVERRPSASRVIALTVVVGSLCDPLLAFDLSFLLSLAATAGLLVLGQPWAARCKAISMRPVRYVVLSLVATVASMIPCTPLLAVMSPELTLVGLVANVIAAPIGELVALPVCLTHAVSSWFPALEAGLGIVGSGALLAVRQVAVTSASIRTLAFAVPSPGPWHFACLGVAALGWGATQQLRRVVLAWLVALVAGLGLVEWAAVRAGQPTGKLRVNMLDVGQGDSSLLELPSGGAVLIDAGGFVGSPVNPGERVVLPWLRAKRRERLDVVVLSHPHPDHFGGLRAVVDNTRIGEFWDTGQGEAEGAGPEYAALLASLRERGVPIVRPRELCRGPRFWGEVRVRVLAPCPGYVPGRDANDNSLVLRVDYRGRSFLFVGDAERHEEHQLLDTRKPELRADVLKVGHHGSNTSSMPSFVAAVRPRFATISSGVRNRFGHPRPATLETFFAAGVVALRTDHMGSLSFVSDGERLDVYAFSLPR